MALPLESCIYAWVLSGVVSVLWSLTAQESDSLGSSDI